MQLEAQHCKICGGTLTKKGDGEYICDYNPTHVFREKSITEQREQMLSLFGEALYKQKEEQVANIRYNLWGAVHEEREKGKYIDSKEVVAYCRELKMLIPEDFQANFYEKATIGTASELNVFLDNIDEGKYFAYITDVLDYLTNPVMADNIISIRCLIERAFKNKNTALAEKYNTICDESEELIKKGTYNENLPRDVFLAYKSQDIKWVNELCSYLEHNGLKCFLSARNLQHGRGAKNNYENKLKKAIDHCKVLVFVSTHLSRTEGDAIGLELPYVQAQDKKDAPPQYHDYLKIPEKYKKPRVEYLIEDYEEVDIREDSAREFFKGFTYRKTPEAVYKAVKEYLTILPEDISANEVKYCKQCGALTKISAKFCGECGNNEFVSTHKAYLAYQEELIKNSAQDILEQEKEKLRKAQEEELARRQRELEAKLKRQQEEKIAAERAELEAQKKELLRKQEELEEQLRKKLEAEYSAKLTEKAAPPKPEESDYPTLENYDKAEFEIEGTVLIKYLLKDKKGEVKIPQGVTEIGEEAFKDCRGLTGITIPNSIKSIGKFAFYGCSGLENLTIPNSVMTIGVFAFGDCSGLTSITISNSVKSIRDCVFFNCSGLTSIKIPRSVTTIDDCAFLCCRGLESIAVLEGNKVYYSKNNCIIEKKSKKLILGCKNSVIPSDGSVTSIGYCAFNDCSGLTSITIPTSVTTIEDRAFSCCSELTGVTMPKTLESRIKDVFDDEEEHIIFTFTK